MATSLTQSLQKVSSIAGVPILDCPNGIFSIDAEWNFIAYKEGMAEYIEATHGDIAWIFRTNEYPVHDEEIYDPADYTHRLKDQWIDDACT